MIRDDAASGTLPAGLADLGRPELAPLWCDAHARLSSGRSVSTLRPGPLDADQQVALADLLGLDRLPGPEPAVSRHRLDALLHEMVGADIATVVTALVGPLENRAAERAELAAQREALWAWLFAHPVVVGQPALRAWAAWARRSGLVGRSVTNTRALLAAALDVVAALPADGVALPGLADRLLHDPHALDDGGRLGPLVVRALAALQGVDPPADAAARRAVWRRAGVTDDALSSSVLVAGALTSHGLVGAITRACLEEGQAASLTLAQLRVTVPEGPTTTGSRCLPGAPAVVRVVENPSVLASALHRYGPRCPPLVCVSGWPSAEAMLLLRALAAGGATLHYHGDLDADGVRIAAHVIAATEARPWRMSVTDYTEAVARRPHGPPVGRVTDAPWDAGLAAAMTAHGVAVTEEQVTEDLLADLLADLGTDPA